MKVKETLVPVAETPWQQLLRYLAIREPGFSQRARGATPDEWDCLLACCPRLVPTGVVELFSSMGHGCPDVWPFGKCFSVDVAAMLNDLEYQCVADRFFRVAMAVDAEGMGDADLYVDLDNSNGYDAPLITIVGASDRREPHAMSHTLMSKAIARAFLDFDIRRSGEFGSIGQGIAVEDVSTYCEAIRALAARMGLRPVFCPRDDLQCYAGDSLSLMFDAIGPGIPQGVVPGEEPLPSRALVSVWLGVDDACQAWQVPPQTAERLVGGQGYKATRVLLGEGRP